MNSKKFPMLLVFTSCVCLMVGFALGRKRISGITVDTALPVPSTTLPAPTAAPSPFPIDLNTATVEELVQVNGIGPSLAKSIVEYRTTHGKFTNVADLLNISGIGEKKFEAIKAYVTVGNGGTK